MKVSRQAELEMPVDEKLSDKDVKALAEGFVHPDEQILVEANFAAWSPDTLADGAELLCRLVVIEGNPDVLGGGARRLIKVPDTLFLGIRHDLQIVIHVLTGRHQKLHV